MKINFIYFIIFILFLCRFSVAQTSNYIIELEGLDQTSPQDYEGITQSNFTAIGDSAVTIIKEKTSSVLTSLGFIDHSLEITLTDTSQSEKEKTIRVKVIEGKKYIVDEIIVESSSLEDDSHLIRELNILTGTPLNDAAVIAVSDKILEHYLNEGFLFARVKLNGFEKLEEDEDEVQVKLNFIIVPERKSVIDKVLTEGNDATDADVIVREIRLTERSVFNQSLSEKIVRRLKRLNIFSRVGTPEYFIDQNDKGTLKISLAEGNTNSFDGIIGYIPGTSGKEKGYFSGLVNMSFRNLFGTMRAFSLKWQQVSRSSQDLEINYFEPWLFGLPINLYPSFFQRKQDSTYVQRNIGLKTEVLASEFLSFSLSVHSEKVIPSAERTISLLSRSTSLSVGGGVKFDTRDDVFFPTEGLVFRTDYFLIRKEITKQIKSSSARIDLRKIVADFDYYQPTFTNQIFAVSVHGRELRGNDYDISDLFRLGGTNTLRGYEENQFSGSRLLWMNNEYRVLLAEKNFVFVFLDVGYYYRNIMNDNLSKVKFGYGLGVAVDSPLGILKVNYALGEGDSISKGKIHFGIINAF
ncbi:MAG: hypothetical protein FJ213_04255 [Ignavibacteria bacterium]|nr:hypothetical protein [Ignavibacteria bacterium]